ncbi:MAG: hypothetical protein K5988_08990 [Lachnospiraceae bacterium]|nr:hypothetical protein [Lachnospiraceae bacterium]
MEEQMTTNIIFFLDKNKNFIRFKTDDADKRKQRIVLTDYCREFCERNDELSSCIMEKMFDGVPEEDIATTIRTIIKIEKNLRNYEG